MAASGGIDLLRNLERREIFTENLKPINLLETNRVKPLYQRDVKGCCLAIFLNLHAIFRSYWLCERFGVLK